MLGAKHISTPRALSSLLIGVGLLFSPSAYGQIGGYCCNNISFDNGYNFWQAFTGSATNCCPIQIAPNATFQTYSNSTPSSLSGISGLPAFTGTGSAIGDTIADTAGYMVRREQCVLNFCEVTTTYGFLSSAPVSGPAPYMEWVATDIVGNSIITPDTIRVGLDFSPPTDTLIQASGDTLYWWDFQSVTFSVIPNNGQSIRYYVRSMDSPDGTAFGVALSSFECVSCPSIPGCSIGYSQGGCATDTAVVFATSSQFDNYIWSNGATTNMTTFDLPLTSPVFVTASNDDGFTCVSQKSFIPTVVNADFVVNDSCHNDFWVTELATSSPTLISAYHWEFGQGTGFVSGWKDEYASFSTPGPHIISLAVRTQNGCWDTISKPVTFPNIPYSTLQAPLICEGDSFMLENVGTSQNMGNVEWVVDGINYGIQDSLIFANAVPGSHTVRLYSWSLAHACPDTLDTTFVVHERPNLSWMPAMPACESEDTLDLWSRFQSNQGGIKHFLSTAFNDDRYFYPAASGPGTFPVVGVFENTAGCYDTLVGTVEVAPDPILTVFGSGQTCAEGAPVNLRDLVQADTVGLYLFDHFACADSLFYPTISGPGTYPVEVIFINWLSGCSDTAFVSVDVFPIPEPVVADPNPICVTYGPWQPVKGTPSGGTIESYYVDDQGVFQPDYWGGGVYDFTYFVADSFGCTGSDSYALEVFEEDCFCTFFLPSAFSPNADGLNEEFGPKWECDLIDYHMEIWNRWGHLVFETTDPNEKWDGSFNGGIPKEDMYLFKVSYTGTYLDVNLNETVKSEIIQGEVFLVK